MKLGLAAICIASTAHADSRLINDDTFAVDKPGPIAVDAGVSVALPSALPTGMATGLGAGVTRTCGCLFAYGARASFGTVTESDLQFTVTHDEYKLRAFGEIRHVAGRGTLALRLGVGPTVVHEDRVLSQGMRAGNAMETTGTALLPAGELEGVVSLQIIGAWSMVASAGPSLDVFDGHLRGGWTAGLGVGWAP